ncbi:NAD(P)-binding protein [Lophiostoma macrostomum CBS 122681]|uniref:NAD(P)-binding protein n=1 Tax=Lophiostoma macrostomum CBS 122681 TaxID=1314788 RepID=A0A6A6SM43_9PLEO|nr:NAD(P)-binding protein [Lophiostoma macrostomum CBS 122681]
MSHRILVTGASGYLGGTLLARWKEAQLPPYSKLYALVRKQEQANAVKEYGAEPITIDCQDPEAIKKTLVDNKITIILYLIDALGKTSVPFIEGLSEVKEATGQDVHFVFTTGAKLFSSHVGTPTDKPLLDTNPALYDIQKSLDVPSSNGWMRVAVDANNTVIEKAGDLGVRAYIFAPCIVYGKGEGFGNKISIQTVAIVKAAKKVRRVYKVDKGRPTWPVCHVVDNSTLYLEIVRNILAGKDIGHGRDGYFLGSAGSVAWDDLYAAMAQAMAKRGAVDDAEVKEADDEVLQKMGNALDSHKEMVPVHLGGSCTFTAEHGRKIGWKPQYEAQHILEAADEEVELILENLE